MSLSFSRFLLRFSALSLALLLWTGCSEPTPTTEEVILQADELMKSGQMETAIRILEARAQVDGERIDLLEPLAFAYAALDDPTMAAFTFTRMAEVAPELPEYHLYAASSYQEAGDSEAAVGKYRAYLALNPSDRAIWSTLGDLERDLGNRNAALEAYLKAETQKSRGSTALEIGTLFLQGNNLAQAQRWFAVALQGEENVRPDALLGLLETALRSKKFADAEKLVTTLEKDYPAYLATSNLADAPADLKAWRAQQEAAKAATAAIRTESDMGNTPAIEASEETTDEVAETNQETESTTEPEVNQAEVAIADESTETLEAAGFTPGEASPEISGSTTEEVEEDPASANESTAMVQNEESSPESNPEVATEPEPVAQIDPIRALKSEILANDSRPDLWFELSKLYWEKGDYRWAQASASEAVRRDPENPRYRLQFLQAAQKTMTTSRLLSELEAAYRDFPNSPEILITLARAYQDQGLARNANILYDRFLQIAPADHPGRSGL